MTPYRILWDYGSYEGMKFDDKQFATAHEALESAMKDGRTPFTIVMVVQFVESHR